MKKFHHIEFLRFVFSVIIVYFHVLHENIMPYTGGNHTYRVYHDMCRMAYTLVDAFLIMAGYFIYTSWRRAQDKSFIEFAFSRFFRMWPVFAFYVVCMLFVQEVSTEELLQDFALLRSTGISFLSVQIVWYVAPFFWASLLMYGILKVCKRGTAALSIALISYFGYLVNINYTGGGVSADVVNNMVSLVMLRVSAGIGVGVLIAMGIEEFTRIYGKREGGCSKMQLFIGSVAEAICIILLLSIVLRRRPFVGNVITVVVLFSVLFVCFVNKLGVISRMLDYPVFGYAGRYAYSIYVMQQISFEIMKKSLWLNSDLLQRSELGAVLLSVAFSVLVGIAVYYLVERPAYLLFRKWEAKRKRASLA